MAMPMICGIILCIYPYFTDNVWILVGTGIVLAALPFAWWDWEIGDITKHLDKIVGDDLTRFENSYFQTSNS